MVKRVVVFWEKNTSRYAASRCVDHFCGNKSWLLKKKKKTEASSHFSGMKELLHSGRKGGCIFAEKTARLEICSLEMRGNRVPGNQSWFLKKTQVSLHFSCMKELLHSGLALVLDS